MQTIPYTGDASILANCLKSALASAPNQRDAEYRAFKVATCRRIDRTNPVDLQHLADAYKLLGL